MQITTRNYTVDAVRLIASLFVVMLHVGYLGVSDEQTVTFIRLACRWAVPVFFMISGYFFQIRYAKSPADALVATCLRLGKVFLITCFIYWPFAVYRTGVMFRLDYLYNGTHPHLWFLSSMILGFLVLYGLMQIRIPDRFLLVMCVVLIAYVLFKDSYANVVYATDSPLYVRRRMLLSIPFLFFGMYIKKREEWFNRLVSYPLGIGCIVLGYLTELVEAYHIRAISSYIVSQHEFLIGTILMAFGVFVVALTYKSNASTLSEWGTLYSLLIYLYHPLLLNWLNIDTLRVAWQTTPFLFPIVSFTLTLLLVRMIHTYLPRLFNILSGSFTVTLPNRLATDKKA